MNSTFIENKLKKLFFIFEFLNIKFKFQLISQQF